MVNKYTIGQVDVISHLNIENAEDKDCQWNDSTYDPDSDPSLRGYQIGKANPY